MVLLDTCVLLWLSSDQSRLSVRCVEALTQSAGACYVSAISAFEIGVKQTKGKLQLSQELETWFSQVLQRYHVQALPVDWQVAAAATQLPPVHSDPADRLIIATAISRGLQVITPDRHFPHYAVDVVW
jgi:PIN domain nuclease of toxin-antitoxin system